jgi:hypothetical protein
MDAREDRTAKDPESVVTTSRPYGSCEVTWGNCDRERTRNMRHWGPPTATPHTCSGPKRHLYRLHVCHACNTIGNRVMPSPYSKAGAQLRAATMKQHKLLADGGAK